MILLRGPDAPARHVQSRVVARHWTLQAQPSGPMPVDRNIPQPSRTDYLRLNWRLITADKELDECVFQVARAREPASKDAVV
ncbi:MAG: hypothetical protein EOS00_30055 [Mesorhizobium sp.]|nr:MAG: hypothetical protein EOR81_30350 [Mesorhizobium sp.]RWN53665.1 MAG: hypothetical protein EOS00_30055 [Mesorhizobium sp.]